MRDARSVCWPSLTTIGLVGFGYVETVDAHGLGRRYDLPVPLGLYLYAAGAIVAVSFLLIAWFLRSTKESQGYPRLNLLDYKLGQMLVHPVCGFVFQLFGVSLLIMVVTTGLFGTQRTMGNFAPVFVWIIWWVGLAYVSALLGNLWLLVNPWHTGFAWAEAVYRRLRPGCDLSLYLPYPPALGVWPSVILFLAFVWAELVYPGAAVPANVATMVLAYSLITWGGMFIFGRERWLKHGEAFSLVFGVLARFAPMELRVSQTTHCKNCAFECLDRQGECINCSECYEHADRSAREWSLRPYAVGLLREETVSASMMAFVLLMLSTILFDGFLATAPWTELAMELYAALPNLGGNRLALIRTFGLIASWMLFLAVYGGVCYLISASSGRRLSTWESAVCFIYTLVPIAIAYHLAHYLTYLLVQGQFIIPLLSDPFGYGWDLLGTRDYLPDIAVVGARFTWYASIIVIVSGHVIAVYLAHVKAIQKIPDARAAQRSQYPMTMLMVIYTFCGLWVLAQPIVNNPVTTGAFSPVGAR
jgi:hypothetical protein